MRAAVKYKIRIYERKRETWERDLSEMNEVDLFGNAYKLMKKGKRKEVVLKTMKKVDGTWTSGEEETMKYVLDELLPGQIGGGLGRAVQIERRDESESG